MDANEYQKKAQGFATGGGKTLVYSILGAIEELGELVDKVKFNKIVFEPFPTDLPKEVGYVLGCFSGLSSEAGALAKKIRKDWDKLTDESRDALTDYSTSDGIDKEAGDVAWMLSGICENLGLKLNDVMENNIRKLTDRKNRGVIVGEGDNR